MSAPNFVLITELQTLTRRDFPVTDATIIPPLNSNAVVDGEWLEMDTSPSYTLKRGASGSGVHEGTNALVWPVHTEKGRYDVQAISKVNVLFGGMYEAETAIANTAGLSVGTALTVQDVNVLGFATRRGLGAQTGAEGTGVVVVGYVTRLISEGLQYPGMKIRFMHFGNQKLF